MEKKLNNKNFIAIADWMVSNYDFNTRELLCYAIVYGFSQDGESKFSGSLSYLAQWLNITRRDNVLRYLNGLIEKGVITKEKVVGVTKTWCEYTALANKGKTSKSDHIIISPWMIENLGLKDKELILYALIYGFSRNGSSSYFTGNNAYMAKWLKVDKQHVNRYTSALIKKGLIEKIEENNCVKYRAVDIDLTNSDPNQNEYTLARTEGNEYNQNELETNQIEYTPNQNEYRANQFEEETLTNLSTNNIFLNNLNNNLNIISNNNSVVDEINSDIIQSDLTEEEKELLIIKNQNDLEFIKKYKNCPLNIVKILKDIARNDFIGYLIYNKPNESNQKAKDLLFKTLNLKRYSKRIEEINNLQSETVKELFNDAYSLFDEDSLREKDIRKSPEAYFIGIVDNVLDNNK